MNGFDNHESVIVFTDDTHPLKALVELEVIMKRDDCAFSRCYNTHMLLYYVFLTHHLFITTVFVLSSLVLHNIYVPHR